MRRAAFISLNVLFLCAMASVVWFGFRVWGDLRDNGDIRAFATGRNAELREDASARAVHGRILFLTYRDRLPEAQEMLPFIVDTSPALLAEAQFAIGNARMRAAFETIETGLLENAVPEVNLAKEAYRDALRANPTDWDAKVNLDLAMRLVRDLPRPEADGESDPDNRPRRLWTDLPGMPRGAP